MTDGPDAPPPPGAPRGPDGRFRNTHSKDPHGPSGALRWMATRRAAPWPPRVADPPQPPPPRLGADRIGATFIGHATWYLQVGGLRVLTDPIWSERASPLPFAGPRRVRAPGQTLSALPGVDLVLVSHNHYDHMDLPTLRTARARFAPRCVTGLGNAAYLAAAGFGDAAELDWWRTVEVGGVAVTYVPAQHFSARGLGDRDRALWGGFVLRAPGGAAVYVAADTGWSPHFAEVGAHFPGLHLALLPVGAYAPRWFMAPVHMDPDEAVRAHLALGARRSLGMHFGTFAGLTDEPLEEPAALLAAARARHGVAEEAFGLLPFGATLDLPAD